MYLENKNKKQKFVKYQNILDKNREKKNYYIKDNKLNGNQYNNQGQ